MFGDIAATALGGIFFQGSNEKQKKAKVIEQHYKKMAKVHMAAAEEANQDAATVEHEIKLLDEKVFVDSGESNADIVNRIHSTGL